MKTLDEVIFEAPYSPTPWEADALHYLKKLKRIEAKIEKIATGNIEDTLSKMDNPPLTWDELRQMKGKPVWVEHNLFKGWRLVGWQANEHLMVLVGPYSEQLPLFEDGCGKDWQAYRKERS